MSLLTTNSKMLGAGTGAAIAVIVLWLITLTGIPEIPEYVQGSITVLVTAIVTWLFPANEPME